ncbi:hypothetical protein C7S15_8616 [Burkholderia cepacia]|nr:hypothetical protein [Burkholderia cepacia]
MPRGPYAMTGRGPRSLNRDAKEMWSGRQASAAERRTARRVNRMKAGRFRWSDIVSFDFQNKQ